MKTNTQKKPSEISIDSFYFPQGHLWRQKNLILFLLYTILKTELFSKSPSHQHNVHTVPPTVTESPGFGTQPGSPKASWSHIWLLSFMRAKTISLLRHLCEARLQCLNSWVCGGKISRNQNQKQDNSQKSRGLSALWNDDQKHKTFSSYVYTHTTITAFSHFRLNSILCYW